MAKVSSRKKVEKKVDKPETDINITLLQKNDFKFIKFTTNQLKLYKIIQENIIVNVTGYAGTSKTFLSCYAALDAYSKGTIKKIVLVKPAVEAGDQMGFLPGSLDEKIAPFMDSYLSNMEKIISKEKVLLLIEKGVIEMKSLSHIRGSTEDESFMIMDETQNSDLRQIMLFVTRMGKDSKIVICGDITQYDNAKRRKDFTIFSTMLEGLEGVKSFAFSREDIVRHKLLIEITDRYEKYKNENNLN